MDGGLKPRGRGLAAEVVGLSASVDALSEALGLEAGEGPNASGDIDATLSGLAARVDALGARARNLVADERRARQAAASFRAASLALSRSPDSNALLEELLDYLNWIVAYDAAQVFLIGGKDGNGKTRPSGSGPLEPRAAREWRAGPKTPLAPDAQALAGRAEGGTLVEEREGGRLLYLPLRGPEGPLGEAVIAREGDRAFDEEEIREAEAFAGQAAAALRNASLYEDLRRADGDLLRSYETSIELLSKTLDLRDHETEGHSLRVAEMSTALARVFGMDDGSIALMRRGALLHDIGKIGIPDAILLKPGPLDEEEFAVMRRHPTIARELFEGIPFLRGAIEVPWCHHERWDGRGYPRALAGESIPLAARVFSVVDVWDALTHDRPYRKALSEAESLAIIAKGSGNQFDPLMVQFFLGSFDLF
jgi:HD-GYP domain-containing protein (c-di-GMP phosphodiesterase class II)